MNDQIDISLLERYLAGEIESHEVLDLKGSPISDEELRSAVESHQELIIHLEGIGLKSDLQRISELKSTTVGRQNKLPRWLAIAASILIIGIVGVLIVKSSRKEPTLSDYFSHFDQLVTFRGAEQTAFAEGMDEYSRKNYEKAYVFLTKVESDTLRAEFSFYAGVSAIGSNNFEGAVELFEAIGTDLSNKYYQQTRWYLALAYWQIGKTEEATTLLKKIQLGEFEFEQSRKLLQRLK